MKTFEPQSW